MPCKRRSFKRKCSKYAPASLRCVSINPPKKRKCWQEESVSNAVKAVQEGQSISEGARDHGVPKTTLYDRVSGRVQYGSYPGPQPYLNNQEEKELATYSKHCARVDYGKTRRDVPTVVETAA